MGFFIFLASLLLLVPLAIGEEFTIEDLSAGMWSNPTANRIPDNGASVIQNFNTDIEALAVERNGYVKRDTTILGGTKPVTGLWSFVDPTGSEWIISFSSRTFYRNIVGGIPSAFGLSPTVDTIPDAAVNLGRIWFVNGTNDLWWFDGTSTGTVSSAPDGILIEAWRNRLVIGNITGSQSTLRFSEDGDGESWTIGGNPTDPFSVQIGGANDGQRIRCLKGSYLDSLIVGRKYDLWALDGFDQSDLFLRNVSLQVGCLESNSMQEVDNELIFLSARGVERMRGRNIQLASEPIRNVVDVIVKNTINQRSNTQTSQTDWAAGSQDPSRAFSTNVYPGDLRPVFPDTFSSFRDGSGGTPSVWGEYNSGSTTGGVSADGDLDFQNDGNTLGRVHAYTLNTLTDWAAGTTFYFHISSFTNSSGGFPTDSLFFTLRSTVTTSSNADTVGIVTRLFKSSTTTGFWQASVSGPGFSSSTISTNLNLLTFPTTVQFHISTTTWQLTVNSALMLSGSHTEPTPREDYAYFGYLKGSTGTGVCSIDNFRVQPKYSNFTSQLINIGSLITSWGPVTISDTQTDGTLSYLFGSTNTASVSAISNWQTIVNGQVPTISTNPYAAFKVIMSTPSDLTDNRVYLSEFITTWSEGAQIPSPVSWVYDNRYWISFTTSTQSNPYQDAVFVLQRNKSWVFFKGINAASFTTWRDAFYFGNSNSTGYVYKFDVGNNDDGEDIESLIVTKSYEIGQPFREKEFRRLYANYLGGSGFTGNFSISYDLDRFGSFYSLGSVNMSESNGLASIKFPFAITNLVRGREIQYRITKNDGGDRLRIHSLSTQYDLKEER